MDKDQDKRENLEDKKDSDIDKKEENGQEQEEIEKDIENEITDDNIIKDQDSSKEASNNQQKSQPVEDTQKDLTKEETKEDKTSKEKEDIEDKDASDKQSEDKTESEDNKEELSKSNSKESSTNEKDQNNDKDSSKKKKEDDIESSAADDDELWDTDSSLDDLDLDIFEDDDQELTEDDKDIKEVDKQDSLENKDEEKKEDEDLEEDKDKGNENNASNKILKKLPPLKSLIFWGVIGLESLLIIIGFFTIYRLTSPYFNSNNKSPTIKHVTKNKIKHSSRSKNTNLSNYPFDKNKVNLPSSAKVLGTAIISLQPFYIPVVYEGEVVFLKLHVTLTVSDSNTKAILEHRLSLIRNIIYENLKGIVISPSERGNFLLRYCDPLKQALNSQLAPYKITDINLMGFILK